MILGAETKFDTRTKQQAIFVVLECVAWGEKPGFKSCIICDSFKMFPESFYFLEL